MANTIKQVKVELDELKNSVLRQQTYLKWSAGITAIATIVIAILTFAYWKTTQDMLSQVKRQADQTDETILVMKKANQLQNDYYQNTIRPFVYAHDGKFETKTVIQKDTIVVLKFNLMNVGPVPAKEVRVAIELLAKPTEKFKSLAPSAELPLLKKVETDPVSTLFPLHNVSTIDFEAGEYTLRTLRLTPWFHGYISYKDAGDKEYHYKWIGKIGLVSNEWRVLLVWDDFQ